VGDEKHISPFGGETHVTKAAHQRNEAGGSSWKRRWRPDSELALRLDTQLSPVLIQQLNSDFEVAIAIAGADFSDENDGNAAMYGWERAGVDRVECSPEDVELAGSDLSCVS
jgi:hypothetical protein